VVAYEIPRLLYLLSDVVMIVGNEPLQDSSYKKRCDKLKAIASGDRFAAPALIIVINKASSADCLDKDNGKFRLKTIHESTNIYLNTHDPNKELKKYFSNICCICIPNYNLVKINWDPEEDYKEFLEHQMHYAKPKTYYLFSRKSYKKSSVLHIVDVSSGC